MKGKVTAGLGRSWVSLVLLCFEGFDVLLLTSFTLRKRRSSEEIYGLPFLSHKATQYLGCSLASMRLAMTHINCAVNLVV